MSKKKLLLSAAKGGDIDEVRRLLDGGAKVNVKDKEEMTPLCFAAMRDHTEIAALLIHRGADVNAPNHDGWTPLHIAGGGGRTATVSLLLDRGADVNARMDDGTTPLYVAATFGFTEIAALTTVAAFVIVMFSGIVPLRRFGGVTAVAITACLVTSLTLMPALLYRLSRNAEQPVEEKLTEQEATPQTT